MKAPIHYLIFSILILATVISCSGEEQQAPDKASVVTNEKGEVLAPEERSWKNELIGEEISLHSGITDSLLNGMAIKRDGNHLYISDYGDMKVKKFSLDGRFVDSFGGKGRGPGEFQQVTDFDITESGRLYVIDSKKMEMLVFDSESMEIITEHKLETKPYRMAIVDDHIIIEATVAEKLFGRYNFEGTLKSRFGEIMDNQEKNAASVSGDIYATDNDTGFVYAPIYASYLFQFSGEGNRTLTTKGPDRIPFKETVQQARGDMRLVMPPRTEFETIDLKIFGNRVYDLLENKGEDNDLPQTFMDIYDLKSGGYLHSVALPVPAREIFVSGDRLYLINPKTAKVKAF